MRKRGVEGMEKRRKRIDGDGGGRGEEQEEYWRRKAIKNRKFRKHEIETGR